MMLFSLALAETPTGPKAPSPLLDDGTLVHRVVHARPFQLEAPHPYRYQADFTTITSGWIVHLEVAAWTMLPRPMAPNLWVGDRVAGRLHWGDRTEGRVCAAFWVPGDLDPRQVPVFFGSIEPADRIDAARRSATVQAASALPKVAQRTGISTEPLRVKDFRALREVAGCPER